MPKTKEMKCVFPLLQSIGSVCQAWWGQDGWWWIDEVFLLLSKRANDPRKDCKDPSYHSFLAYSFSILPIWTSWLLSFSSLASQTTSWTDSIHPFSSSSSHFIQSILVYKQTLKVNLQTMILILSRTAIQVWACSIIYMKKGRHCSSVTKPIHGSTSGDCQVQRKSI